MNALPQVADLIQSGPFVRPQKIVVYGPNGVGKSTLASQFPGPLFLDTEDGTSHLDVRRIRALDADTFHNVLRALTKSDNLDCQTLVVDTIDMAERYVRDRLLRIHRLAGIEEFGYGKGWVHLREQFDKVLAELDSLNARGLHIIAVGHSTIRRFQPPLAETGYDRYQLKLDEVNSNRLKEWADAVLFVNWDVHVSVNREGKPRGVGGRKRLVHTTHSAGFDAKVRIALADELPCEFNALQPLLGAAEVEGAVPTPTAAQTETAAPPPPPPPSRTTTAYGDFSQVAGPELRAALSTALAELDLDLVLKYLVSQKRIPEDGSLANVSDGYARWIVNHLPEFKARLEKFEREPF